MKTRKLSSESNACKFIAGGQPREHSWLSNEEGYATADMESDQLHVPAFIFRKKKCELLKPLLISFLSSVAK